MAARKAPTPVALDDAPMSVNMLVYGKSGIGKTVLGAGRGGADLIISCEKDRGVSAKRQGGKGKIIWCQDFDQFMDAKKKWEDGEYGDPEWTLFDSLTSIQDKAIQWILAREYRKAGGEEGARKLDVLQLQDHLEYQNLTRRLMSELCDTPRNAIFTAQEMNVETDGGEESVLPLLEGGKGKISNFTCGMMTCVGYMKVIERPVSEGSDETKTIRRIYWQPKPPYFGKDWTDSLGKFTDNKTLTQLWKQIQGSGTSSIDAAPTPRRTAAAKTVTPSRSRTRARAR